MVLIGSRDEERILSNRIHHLPRLFQTLSMILVIVVRFYIDINQNLDIEDTAASADKLYLPVDQLEDFMINGSSLDAPGINKVDIPQFLSHEPIKTTYLDKQSNILFINIESQLDVWKRMNTRSEEKK